MPRVHRWPILVLGGVWLAAVVAGFATLGRFESREGQQGTPPSAWPPAAPIERAPDRPTLVVFAHPRCPCTSATIEELNRLLARSAGRVHALVVFYSDPRLGDEWVRSPSFEAAARIPGVTVVEDPRGATARVFGARTSGQTCLYDRAGRLLFAGGMTVARGHVGDNDGSRALQALIAGAGGGSAAPVFGCDLLGPSGAEP